MGHIKRGNCGIAQRSREREPPPTSTPSAGERRAYGQSAIVSCIMALEIVALIALAITSTLQSAMKRIDNYQEKRSKEKKR